MSLTRSSTTNAAQNAASAAQNAASQAQAAARNAAQNAAAKAASAAQNAGGVAQTAANSMSKGVRQGVHAARGWAAPRLDSAADYCTTTVAPKVSATLRSTARQVSPAATRDTKRSALLTWSVLGAAVLAAVGAAAAMVRYRYRTAIAADSETADEVVPGDPTGSQAAPVNPDGTRSTAAMPKDQRDSDSSTETSVNGRVTSSGW